MIHRPISKLKGDERQYAIEDAARTLKDFARIKKDKPLLKAAREELKREIDFAQKAIKT